MTSALPLAELFQALADPTRLRILALLREMELSVGELAQVLAQSQPRVSRHLKLLCDSGLAERRKEGSWVFLTLGQAELSAAFFALTDQAADAATGRAFAADRVRLTAVRRDRAAAAERKSPRRRVVRLKRPRALEDSHVRPNPRSCRRVRLR